MTEATQKKIDAFFHDIDEPVSREKMKELGSYIEKEISGNRIRFGFALLVFEFERGGWMRWISNANRKDMLVAMMEFIEKNIDEDK